MTGTENFGDSFANVSILDGQGTVDGIPVSKGQHFIVPAGYGIVISGQPFHDLSPRPLKWDALNSCFWNNVLNL